MINLREQVCVFLQCYSIFAFEDIFFFLVHCPNITCVFCIAPLLILRIRVSHFIFHLRLCSLMNRCDVVFGGPRRL